MEFGSNRYPIELPQSGNNWFMRLVYGNKCSYIAFIELEMCYIRYIRLVLIPEEYGIQLRYFRGQIQYE